MEKRSTLFLSLFCCITVCSARCADSISVLITQPEVYIVKNEWAQQINFNPNIANRSSEAVTLERIELRLVPSDLSKSTPGRPAHAKHRDCSQPEHSGRRTSHGL